ncbi:MAG: EamA family transporter [Anaerolineae bacterium]
MFSVFLGLASALSWGAADFAGGLASKQARPYQVLFLAELGGLVPLFFITLLVGEPFPSLPAWLWSMVASILGTFGLLIFYRALAEGQMSLAAPVSALLAAIVPLVVGVFRQGFPALVTFWGFGLALVAIWTISQTGDGGRWKIDLHQLRWPFLAGLFFGLYFVLIHQATQEAFFWPLVGARLTGTLIMLAYVGVVGGAPLPGQRIWPLVVLGGVLDVAGNMFYILAARVGRMDVAAVLGSLYPASTVLLARLLLKETLSREQSLGVLLALGAIVLLTV